MPCVVSPADARARADDGSGQIGFDEFLTIVTGKGRGHNPINTLYQTLAATDDSRNLALPSLVARYRRRIVMSAALSHGSSRKSLAQHRDKRTVEALALMLKAEDDRRRRVEQGLEPADEEEEPPPREVEFSDDSELSAAEDETTLLVPLHVAVEETRRAAADAKRIEEEEEEEEERVERVDGEVALSDAGELEPQVKQRTKVRCVARRAGAARCPLRPLTRARLCVCAYAYRAGRAAEGDVQLRGGRAAHCAAARGGARRERPVAARACEAGARRGAPARGAAPRQHR